MTRVLFLIMCLLFLSKAPAQEKKSYDPAADAEKDIASAIALAKKEKKFVLIQGGGNWCGWCLKFIKKTKAETQLDSMINANFVWYHLNMSPENMNKKVFETLEFPQRFGFPVFIILNAEGKRLHTQNSEYLEDGKSGYDTGKIMSFLEMWSPSAFNPALYEKP